MAIQAGKITSRNVTNIAAALSAIRKPWGYMMLKISGGANVIAAVFSLADKWSFILKTSALKSNKPSATPRNDVVTAMLAKQLMLKEIQGFLPRCIMICVNVAMLLC